MATMSCCSGCSRPSARPDILCFASDYPHWDFDDPKQMIRRFPADWRETVMHDNAAQFFGAGLGQVAR